MNYLENRIARKEYLLMPEEAQRKFEKFEKAFDEKEIKEDGLIKDFAIGMISGVLGVPFPVFICVSQIQLFPKSTDWRVRAIACLFFGMACTIAARCLGLKNLLQFSPLNPIIISSSLIKK